MRFISLGSGSKGNATLIESEQGAVLVDCGFSRKELIRRLTIADVDLSTISALLVTHEHADHIGGVATVARSLNLPVYMTHGTLNAAKDSAFEVRIIAAHEVLDLAGMSIEVVPVPHDAREPCQFIFKVNDIVFGVLSDLGHISNWVEQRYELCNHLFIESNYDDNALADGPYPEALKQRVASSWGHLSNIQTSQFIKKLCQRENPLLRSITLGHLSDKNNNPRWVFDLTESAVAGTCPVNIASQESGTGWINLD